MCRELLLISSCCVTCSASPSLTFLSFPCPQFRTSSVSSVFLFISLTCAAPSLSTCTSTPHCCVCIQSVCFLLSLSVCPVFLCGPPKPVPVSSCYLIVCSWVFAPCVLTNFLLLVVLCLAFVLCLLVFSYLWLVIKACAVLFVLCFCIWELNFFTDTVISSHSTHVTTSSRWPPTQLSSIPDILVPFSLL